MAVVRIPTPGRPWGGRRYELDLRALEPGDTVATVATTYGGPEATVWTVTKFTPTQVVCESVSYGRTHSARWRLSDGKRMGESYGNQLLDPDDTEVINAHQGKVMGLFRDRVERVMKDLFRTPTGQARKTTHQEKVAALAEVAELTAATAEKLNALEARRLVEVPDAEA